MPCKPDPACVPDLAAALESEPQDIAMVGDSTTNLEAARNAGFRAVAVTWGYRDRDRLYTATPDLWVGRPAELPALVTGA